MIIEFQSSVFDRFDFVTDTASVLIIFCLDRALQGRSKSIQLEVTFGCSSEVLWNFTDVFLSAMDIGKQRFEILFENYVIVRAS